MVSYNVNNTVNDGPPYNVNQVVPNNEKPVSEATLQVHAAFLIVAATTLLFTSFYGGVLSPILRLAKVKYFNTGYAHKPHLFTTFLSTVFFFGLVATPFYLCWVSKGYIDVDNLFTTLKYMFDYWRTNSQYNIEQVMFWYIYPMLLWGIAFQLLAAIFARAEKNPPPRTTLASLRHAFIIVAHNSSGGIEPTIRALLKLVRPHQIYIADNGSSQLEQVAIND